MIYNFNKISSKLDFYVETESIKYTGSSVLLYETGSQISIPINVVNYFADYQYCSIKDVKYSKDNKVTWHTASLSQSFDSGSMKVGNRQKTYNLYWNAADDIGSSNSASIDLAVTMNDNSSSLGTDTDEKTYDVPFTINFTPTTTITLLRPYPAENEFKIKWFNLYSPTAVKVNYKVEVDTDPSFTSGDLKVFSSDTDTGFTVSGSSFPTGGIDTWQTTDQKYIVAFETGSLTALSNDKYYVKVSRHIV